MNPLALLLLGMGAAMAGSFLIGAMLPYEKIKQELAKKLISTFIDLIIKNLPYPYLLDLLDSS